MYTEKELAQLEQEERVITEDSIAILLLLLATTKGNLEKELRNFYQKYGKDGVVTYAEARKWVGEQNHQRRLTALLFFLGGEFTLLLSKLTGEFERLLKSVIGKETGFFDVKIDLDDVLGMPWGVDDANWLTRLEDDVYLWNCYVANDIKRALHRSANIDKVLAMLDKRFTTMEHLIQALALSESTAVGSLARREIFTALGIKKYQYYAREDERTCDECGSLHGLVFPISAYEVGVTASPIHPRCRCWEVPIMD